ncbi:MAG TPA: class I SAM-dependent methyltransferase [Vicinamibacterales bacterium]|jgi:SAM-dependent methyltransferase|nr:class I SAM-dependent methyltransferase [Vicinamibacterales bacterium]
MGTSLTVRSLRCGILLAALVLLIAPPLTAGRAAQASPAPTQEELKTYEAFRAWITSQPPTMQEADDEVAFRGYADHLRKQGRSESDISATLASLKSIGDRAEIERWNKILTAPKPRFNTAPNAFLVTVTKGLKPGRSLDVGMGQGRNTIYLAQQGWDSVGFDPADRAVASAQEQASKLGVKITTHVARAEDFDWGDSRWDLIVLSYVGAREYAALVAKALRPGGMVVVEGFHQDVIKTTPVGGAVVFGTNELVTIFSALRVIRYEDTDAVGDFGLFDTRVVRLAAIRP